MLLGRTQMVRVDFFELDLLRFHRFLQSQYIQSVFNKYDELIESSHLDAALVDLKKRGARRIVGASFQELLSKPAVEAGVVLFLQLVAILTDTVHVAKYLI